MNLEENQIITLDNNNEYLIVKKEQYNNINYFFLMSNNKPISMMFVKEGVIDGKVNLIPISDNELNMVMNLFIKNK